MVAKRTGRTYCTCGHAKGNHVTTLGTKCLKCACPKFENNNLLESDWSNRKPYRIYPARRDIEFRID